MNYFLTFFIETLFITIAWIILYTNSVDYLRYISHPEIKEIIFQSPLANPEPYELTLYIIFSALFVGVIWIYYKKIKEPGIPILGQGKIIVTIKFAVFIFFLLLFLGKLGDFPLSGESGHFLKLGHLIPNQSFSDKSLYLLGFVIYLAAATFIILEITLMQKILKNTRFFNFIVYATAVVIVGFAAFEARFPLPFLDSSFFYGPVWEITNGKTIFTDIPSQYGFLSILFFSLIYKITSLKFLYLPVLIWVLYIVEYIICFHLILKVGKSQTLAFLGLFSLITINYFSLYHNPQGGPLRWIPIFIALFLFFKKKQIDSKSYIFTIAVLTLWNIDVGAALLLGYLFTLGVFWLTKIIDIKRLIFGLISLFTSFFIIVMLLQIIHLGLGMKFIDFSKLFHTIQKNSALGLVMVPIEFRTYFWLFMLLYFSANIYFFKKQSHQLLLLSANFLFFGSIYFIGRSMPHNLFLISPLAILTVFLLIGLVYHDLNSSLRLLVLGFIFFFFIIYPGFQRKEFLVHELLNKYQRLIQGRVFASEMDELLKKQYSREVTLINDKLKEEEIIILSTDDTYFYYYTKKKNLLDANPSFGIDMKSEMDQAIKRALDLCPSTIAVDCQIQKKCPSYNPLAQGWPNILPLLLGELEKQCKITYKPTFCTDKLCISEADQR